MGIKGQKIAGAILFALILVWGSSILARLMIPGMEIAEAPQAVAPTTATPEAGGAGQPAATAALPLAQRLAAADPAAGQASSRKCVSCHSFEPGGANKIGPNLAGVVAAPVAGKQGFAYSPALQQYGGAWTVERLDAFLAKPAAEVPGTRMTYAGVSDPQERANLIAHLHSLSPDAPPLPQGGAQTADDAPAPPAPAQR